MEQKSKATAFLLCYFLGGLGVHRFYLNRVISGILMLLTLGGLGIWWVVDSILIASGKLSDSNGNALAVGPPDPEQLHAGFWVRTAAISVDGLVLGLVFAVIGVITAMVLPSVMPGPTQGPLDPATVSVLLGATYTPFLLISILYMAVLTASRHQATWGKRAFGLYVSTRSEARVGFLRALWRAVCYLFSALPFYLGYVMAAFGTRKLALHDYLAGTQVMYVPAAGLAVVPVDAGAAPPTRAAANESHPVVQRSGGAAWLAVVLGVALLGAGAFLALR